MTELSGAWEAHIHVLAHTFGFAFIEPVAEYWGAAPWVILASAEFREELTEQRLDPELLFNKNFKYLGDEDNRRQNRRSNAIAIATGVVWRQTMVREFNNAVQAHQIDLYARSSAGEPFRPVPRDVWPSFQIKDWETGYAVGLDSSSLMSIHVVPTVSTTRRGRAPAYDYDKVRGHVFRLLKKKGMADFANDEGWRTQADLSRALEPFCEKVFGKVPARSTLDELVHRAIAEYRSR